MNMENDDSRFAPCKSLRCLTTPPEIEWSGLWPHRAEVPASRGGAWRLTVQLQPEGKPFAWTVRHTTGLQHSAGASSKLDFAIHDAEQAMRELDAQAIPAHGADRDLGPADQPSEINQSKDHDDST